ncbi:structural maintenance of chromosomes flexible hinge domain-containing protein 1-like [Ylistrum balloti]|uniref:structural maintenance of chromosomes flexible hinge domain-containing protein 1-like n=1 Tax=Ylistrum balloti TaxID=509963 RepID=UPI002905E677|nr:structural maintenance of chromosomes flexible hinge domain-containing protein 1-like [Ylistrum balloti]
MATSRRSVGNTSAQLEDDDAFVYVFDRRDSDIPEIKIPTGGLFTYVDFKARVREALGIKKSESFVIATTNREEIKDDDSWDIIDKGDTLYILRNIQQELCAPAQQRVSYLPHYDTIVKGGMYEYYASEGQNPLPYAFAELIDNALAATSNNQGSRAIEIRLHIDDGNPSRNCVYVIDNGKGMTPRQLNNWAIYRLSKFIRKDKRGKVSCGGDEDEDKKLAQSSGYTPLSLNSDISYFGVGGKQAIFFIGNSTRMITKPKESKDVHELTISKEEFQMKEKNQEAIYSGYIRNRQPGDASHIAAEDEILGKVIEEEKDREHFTVVEIHGINQQHMSYLKLHMKQWTRQLAHIYHYYIHGPRGNADTEETNSGRTPSPFKNIDIEVKLFTKGHPQPRVVNLRDVDDDMQTQFIRTAANSFEFKASVEGSGVVEGVLRYHPFLYDRETYPSDANDPRIEPEAFDDHDYAINDRPARGRRPVFECYWNGRLIPYTFIENFDWCAEPKKSRAVPLECYNRISGVLFTNDHFQVSTNKLTFIDLEMRLREKNTVYSHLVNGQERRTAIDREFVAWLKECHDQSDKQIRFSHFKGVVTRQDLPKHKQFPWSVYEQVDWDGKVFKKGQLVRIQRTVPMLLGTIKRFLLYGENDNDVYATGGDIEVSQEPKSLYDDEKIVPLSKLDRSCSSQAVRRHIDEEEAKLPSTLIVNWPEGYEVKQNERRPAGKTVGDIKVQIANKKGELISKLPGTAVVSKKLLVELKVVWHSSSGDEVMVSHISQHGKNWPYWFRKMENIKNLGPHTLSLQVVLNESGANTYAGKQLPSYKIKFHVTEAEPEKFTVGMLDGPFRVGVPFQIPLEFQDEFNNHSKPSIKFSPELEASGLELSYESTQVKGFNLIIKGIVAKGSVAGSAGKSFIMTIKVPGLEQDSQTLKIRLLPGPPHSLFVDCDKELEIENGKAVAYNVEVRDQAGNPTSDAKLIITCKFAGVSGLPTYTLDCSGSGTGTLTGDPINLKQIKDYQTLTAMIELQNHKQVGVVERFIKMLPSNRVASIQVRMLKDDGKITMLKSGSSITGRAGDHINNISFSLFDEAGRKLEIDEKLAGKLKVNWVQKIPRDTVIEGHLPDIKVPATIQDTKYCQVTVQDSSNIDFSFTVTPTPTDPSQIKCKCSGSNRVRIGETLDAPILVTIKDKFGNEITDLPKNTSQEVQVSGDGLRTDEVKVTYSKGKFSIQSVTLERGKTGIRDLKVAWKDFRDFVKLELTAGPPTKLSLPGWESDETVTVLNENKLPRPLIVQLLDEGDNEVNMPDIKIQLAKDTKIKFVPFLMPKKSNASGQVDFGTVAVMGQRGSYDIEPRAFVSGETIVGPKVTILIQPDMTRPVEMKVEYNKKATFQVGQMMPEFTIRILAEDNQPMKGAKAASISMKLWKMDVRSQNTPPSRAVSFSPESVKQNPGVFIFKERKIPEISGIHNIMITYYDGRYELFSNVITVDVKPGAPVKLGSMEQPGTPTVSNTHNAAARCVIRSLKVDLRDEFDNTAGLGYSGKINLEIMGMPGVSEVPAFVGGNRTLQFNMSNGQCVLSNLTLAENSAGKDGYEYFLRCVVECDLIPRNKSIPALDIPFLFYNDAKKQSQMTSLSRQRDDLRSVIKTYKSLFETTEQLVKELKISVHEAQVEENKIREDLRKLKVPLVHLQNIPSVDKLIEEKSRSRDHIRTSKRRTCGLTEAPADNEVLGKIGHLGQIEEEDIARVLSWHMSADMDCVVTLTNKKAKEIYAQTNGKQQVLPIDSIFKKNLPDWKKPLPHVKYKPSWHPPGNPIYARNLIIFPQNEDKCKIVFGMLLGDTLILDNLDHANEYRQELVKYTHCPTILTRLGDRIRSNGKFGGLMNKALSIEKLRGAVFSEPLPSSYHDLANQLELLQNYRVAMTKSGKAKSELAEQVAHMKLPEMQEKYKECREAEGELKDVEQKLGVTMSTPRIPASERGKTMHPPPSSEEGPSASKRPKVSGSTTPQTTIPNGSTTPSSASTSSIVGTPTRKSGRLASMSPVTSDDGRKRLRRT